MASAQTAPAASERLVELSRCLNAQTGFSEVVEALQAGGRATFSGVWGSSCALLAAELANHCPGPVVVVCPHQGDIENFSDDLELFTSAHCEQFPAWESSPGERIIHDEIYGDRLRTLKLLMRPSPPKLVITSIQSLLQPVPAGQEVLGNTRHFQLGDVIDVDRLLRWLVEHGFHNTSAVELPGEFSARGGILDIFAPDWYQPVRLELFGDELESIRRFDISSQRSLETLDEVEVTVLAPSSGARDHFTSFLPHDSWLLLCEPDRLETEGKHYLERQEKPGEFYRTEQVLREINRFSTASAAGLAQAVHQTACHLQIESVERFSGDIARVRDELDQAGGDNEVFVVCQTEAEAERLADIFRPTRLASQGKLHLPVGRLGEGFRLVPERVVLVSGGQLFHRADLRRAPRRRLGKVIDSFLDLRQGDLVVHLAHGIGRYRGLKLLEKDQQAEEHLEIEFHGGTKIFVPASRVDLVQKYVGGRKARPTLAKIGGKSWVRQKQVAQAAVTDLAADLLQLQAARQAQPGIAFAEDTDWQREFDASFPYHETPDQLTAIEAIKRDMHVARPMDRLMCGDVGFGKTELAIRAAFKVVDNGYQVAVLVPTTILAEQHHRTFTERMSEFPFEIAKLSRFATARQQREVIEGLQAGQIDIVIGTHRLASRDVTFQNLGLVVIDEEQRFGVQVKERLKTLRTTVDVMTLTATPIPRTLHMSLVGLRDISNLQTPPEDRLAVQTQVTRFQRELVRHAVLRELNRGGQIYYVHNRIGDMDKLAQKLHDIVPEANIRIGHGQMPEGELEQVMVDFVAGRFDLLLATTIVESGLDIPNANTMFIDEADRYGLADLHQLRGRVGRYKHRAYCYLLVDPHKHISPNAARRLRAIEEFSDMGAGFAIAMRDLEIRGAGNILGTEQSGHIGSVGYELYCQFMEAAVRRLQKLPPRMSIDVNLDLPGDAYLPADYVDDMRLKIDLYRRLARICSAQELAEFRGELDDRFGSPAEPVRRMIALAELKLDAAIWQIRSIHLEGRYVVFTYTSRVRIEELQRAHGKRLRIVDEQNVYLVLPKGVTSPDQILKTIKSVLRPG